MESLIGWNFDLRKQTSLGIFGKVLGWCDTTEEQARFLLHSHVLLFISEFDALVSMLWSNCDTIREAAQKELTTYMMKTMSSTYDVKEEDFIHEKPLKSATISNHQDTVQDRHDLENTQNSITVLRQEDIIQDDEHVELNESAVKDFCRIIPTPVCTKNLILMSHERTCHVFKGFIGKCAVCGKKFTSTKILWNAIKLWNQQCAEKMGCQVFKDDVIFPL
jgi:hypothetical protein